MKIGNSIFKPIDFFVFLSLFLGVFLLAAIAGSANLNIPGFIMGPLVTIMVLLYVILVVNKRSKS